MYESMPAAQVLSTLRSSVKGLSIFDVSEAHSTYGYNELPKKRRSLFFMLLEQFNDVLIYILLGALALSIATPFIEGHHVTAASFTDAYVIIAILILNAALGFIQEFKAEQAIEMLEKLTSPHARVRRDGTEKIIESRELVPGDIVIIEAGDRISADGRVITDSHLRTNESSLTGETQSVAKHTEPVCEGASLADRSSMVFAGTLVARGSAEYVVTAIGLASEIGKIAKLVSETEFPETPLQGRMRQLGKLIGGVVLVMCGFIAIEGLVRGMSFIEVLLIGVSLAVSAVPEGLPAVVTVCLAMGVRRMVHKNALVRRLDSLETLGSVTVICADKTGTITENKMKVVDTWTDGGGVEGTAETMALVMASCNRAKLPDLGDPTEIGLLRYAEDLHIVREEIDEEEVPFTSEEKYMQTRHGHRSYIKGAPEVVVRLCDDVNAEDVFEKNAEFAQRGLRVLAAAVKENGTTRFLGLMALEDPPRAGVDRAIADAQSAGIRTIMITGDSVVTARAIARQVGIHGEAIEGAVLDTIDVSALQTLLQTVSVFARVSPEHKLKILEALQHQGEIVAMSGDGVNDAPALKGAHVGIAMGKNGTEVAREAASIVLADDHYATIVSAITEGRRIYDNIKKFVLFLLRANFDELLLIMTVILLEMPLPFLPIHILWINLMTDGLPALALGMEKAEPDIMQRPPRQPNEHIFHGEWGRLIIAALWAYATSFLFFLWQLSHGIPVQEARTATLTLAIFFELFLAFSARSRRPIWTIGFFTNRWLVGAVSVPLVVQLVLLYSPAGALLQFVPLTVVEIVEIFVLALLGFVAFELLKLVPNEKNRLHVNSKQLS